MDPQMLIDARPAPGLPAPLWFLELFKVLGFTLHAVPMNLWYAGILLAMVLRVSRGEHGRRLSDRLMVQMPVIIAFGVNLGIVPLLFIQLGYAKVFYPATILMAWSWFAIVLLLIPAYYGVYVYSFGVRERVLTPWKRAAGWGAAVLLVAVGFAFTNGLSLMTNVKDWPSLWERHSVAAASLGTALNVGDATFWPRWLLMLGLALTTTAVWIRFDAAWFAAAEGASYRQWAAGFAPRLHAAGMMVFAAAGSRYVFGTWSQAVWSTMTSGPLLVLTAATAATPGLPWLLLWVSRHRPESRTAAALVGLAQFGVLGINAVSRQIVQNLELKEFFDVTSQPVHVQWSPLVVFLVLLVVGLGVVGWMIAQAVKASAEPSR